MNKFKCVIFSIFLFSNFAFSQVSNWISIGANDNTLTRLHFNNSGDTLFVASITGYRFYSLYSSQWVIKEMSGYIGRTVWAISTVSNVYGRVITGRENAFFKGYIELNDSFNLQGVIVRNSQGGRFTDIKYCPNSPNILFACGWSDITPGDLVISTNSGVNWSLLSNYFHTAMTEIAIVPNNNNILYVSGNSLVTKSTNYGNTFFNSSNGLPANLGCYTIAINPINPQVLLTSNDNGIYRSTDSGNNWVQVYNIACRRIKFHPNYQNFVGAISFSPYKVLVSTNAGLNWVDSTGSFPAANMVDFEFSKYDNNIYVASSNSGIYKKLFLITSIGKNYNLYSKNYFLNQNYPNPFNNKTIIEFDIPENFYDNVSLKIYNLNGQQIETLLNDKFSQGSYKINWNGEKYPSGIYFYELKAGDFKETRKMILIK